MDYGKRALFILQVSFLIVFIPVAALIAKGIWDLAVSRVAEIERVAEIARHNR